MTFKLVAQLRMSKNFSIYKIYLSSHADPVAQAVYQLGPLGMHSWSGFRHGLFIVIIPASWSKSRHAVVITMSTHWPKYSNSLGHYLCARGRDAAVVAVSPSFQLCQHLLKDSSGLAHHVTWRQSRHHSPSDWSCGSAPLPALLSQWGSCVAISHAVTWRNYSLQCCFVLRFTVFQANIA